MLSLSTLAAGLLVPALGASLFVLDRLWRRLQSEQKACSKLKAENKELQRQLVKQKEEAATRQRELDAARQSLLARTAVATPTAPAREDFDRTVVLRPDLML